MHRRAISHRVATLLAALQLVLSLGLPIELVLCSSASGHVAIESAVGDDCCADDEATPASHAPAAPDCDGCIDTPISRSILQRDADGQAHLVGPAHVLVLTVPSLRPAGLDHEPRSTAAPDDPPDLVARRSIVLLV